jgi:hydrogenase maturation factor
MSALDKIQQVRKEIEGLEATLDNVLKVLEETKERHNEEIIKAEDAVNDVMQSLEIKKASVKLAEELSQEYEEARREELKCFLILRDAIVAGTAKPDDCDIFAKSAGYLIEPEATEEDPPTLDQTA